MSELSQSACESMPEQFERRLSALMVDYGIESCNCMIIYRSNGNIAADNISLDDPDTCTSIHVMHRYMRTAIIKAALELPGCQGTPQEQGFITVVGKKGGGV